MENRVSGQTEVLNRVIRTVILIIVSLLLSILSVSFAVHHMRLKFEDEFRSISDNKITNICDIVSRTLDGDEIAENAQNAAVKYNDVLALMLADTASKTYTTESYALFLYSDGHLSVLLNHGAEEPEAFEVARCDISTWLNAANEPTTVGSEGSESIIVPVSDSTGRCVAVFEYKCNFTNLTDTGDSLEGKVLTAVMITVAAGVLVYIIQMMIPRIIYKSGKKGQSL